MQKAIFVCALLTCACLSWQAVSHSFSHWLS